MAAVSIRNVVKHYGTNRVIHGLSFDIDPGEFVVFVGPSGCGKSTLLRMIAGLEGFETGEIRIADRVVNGLPAWDRDIAMVFQEYALYPHMSVARNIGFGLKMRKVPRPEIRARVAEAARILQIEHLLDRRPRELSGGQRQRVAMGRAIVRDPEVFLFDEPLSNLDAKLRVDMRSEIKRLHQRLGATMVYVTHDQVEAMTLADRIVVLKEGRIEQIGTPRDLYHEPETRFVAGFIGAPAMNFLPVSVRDGAAALPNGATLPARLRGPYAGPAELGIRPEHLQLARAGEGVPMTVELVEPLGADTLVNVSFAGQELVARLPGDVAPEPGTVLPLKIEVERTALFGPDGLRV